LRSLVPNIAGSKAARVYQCVGLHTANVQQPLSPKLDGRPFLLAVGQHRNNKNLVLLINAFAKLLARGGPSRDMYLLIVGGEGPETSRLKSVISQLSLQQRVHFKTSVTDPELSWLYANCVLFIAPSTTEGFGMPVIEALQCGCRVVCSDIPVFREIAGAACHHFDLQAACPVTALADTVCTALRDQSRQPEMLDRFSAQKIGAQYVSLYAHLLGASSVHTDVTSQASLNRTVSYDRLAG
jgi:glycosyltransferase involved in cell wall biosynthesis